MVANQIDDVDPNSHSKSIPDFRITQIKKIETLNWNHIEKSEIWGLSPAVLDMRRPALVEMEGNLTMNRR